MASDDESKPRDVGFTDRDESQQSEDMLKFQDSSYQFSYGKVSSLLRKYNNKIVHSSASSAFDFCGLI